METGCKIHPIDCVHDQEARPLQQEEDEGGGICPVNLIYFILGKILPLRGTQNKTEGGR